MSLSTNTIHGLTEKERKNKDRKEKKRARSNKILILEHYFSLSLSLFFSPSHQVVHMDLVVLGYRENRGHIVAFGREVSRGWATSSTPAKRNYCNRQRKGKLAALSQRAGGRPASINQDVLCVWRSVCWRLSFSFVGHSRSRELKSHSSASCFVLRVFARPLFSNSTQSDLRRNVQNGGRRPFSSLLFSSLLRFVSGAMRIRGQTRNKFSVHDGDGRRRGCPTILNCCILSLVVVVVVWW